MVSDLIGRQTTRGRGRQWQQDSPGRRRRRRGYVLLLLFMALSLQCFSCASARETAGDKGSSDQGSPDMAAWNAINHRFRRFYAGARQRYLDRVGPLLILAGEEATLKWNGKRETAHLIPTRFTLLKTVSHIPLAVFVRLTDGADSKLSEESRKDLEAFEKLIVEAKPTLEGWHFKKASYDRQIEIITGSRDFIESTLSDGRTSHEALVAFCRKMAPLVLENAYEAVSLELALLDESVKRWKQALSPADWKRLRVIVMSGHMPREQEAAVLYTCQLLQEGKPGRRIVYVEGPPFDESASMKLLGTHILDRDIAIAFFDDEWRMHRDLLSDGAKRYLMKHPPLSVHLPQSQ